MGGRYFQTWYLFCIKVKCLRDVELKWTLSRERLRFARSSASWTPTTADTSPKVYIIVFLNLDIDTVMNTQYCSKHLAKIVHTVKCKSAVEDRRFFFYTRRGWKWKYCVMITATMSKFRNPRNYLFIFLRIFFTCFYFRRDDLRDHRLRPLFRRQGELWWRLQFSSLPFTMHNRCNTLKNVFCILYFPLRSFKYFLTFRY